MCHSYRLGRGVLEGLCTRGPRPAGAAELGGGAYRVEGMKFQMPGWWSVTLEIQANGEQDTVTFNLMVQ